MTCPRSLGWALSAAVAVFLLVAPAQAYYHYVHYAGRAGPFNPLYEKFDLNSNGPTMVPNKTVTFFVSACTRFPPASRMFATTVACRAVGLSFCSLVVTCRLAAAALTLSNLACRSAILWPMGQ